MKNGISDQCLVLTLLNSRSWRSSSVFWYWFCCCCFPLTVILFTYSEEFPPLWREIGTWMFCCCCCCWKRGFRGNKGLLFKSGLTKRDSTLPSSRGRRFLMTGHLEAFFVADLSE